MDWTKVAFVFPGQGSQTIGMGKDFADAYPIVRQTFEQADGILGFAGKIGNLAVGKPV